MSQLYAAAKCAFVCVFFQQIAFPSNVKPRQAYADTVIRNDIFPSASQLMQFVVVFVVRSGYFLHWFCVLGACNSMAVRKKYMDVISTSSALCLYNVIASVVFHVSSQSDSRGRWGETGHGSFKRSEKTRAIYWFKTFLYGNTFSAEA